MRVRDLRGRSAFLAWGAGAWGMNCVVTDEKGRGESPRVPHLLE